MRTKYFYSIFFGFGLLCLLSQKAEAQLTVQVSQDNVQGIRTSLNSSGITLTQINEDNQLTLANSDSKVTIYFKDLDGNGYPSGETLQAEHGRDIPGYSEIMFLNENSILENVVSGLTFLVFDCDDTNPAIISAKFYYEDKDGDGYITNSSPITACSPPEGYISEESIKGMDCDDTTLDTEKPTTTFYFDKDGDGFPSSSGEYCEKPEGYKTADELVSTTRDCNDNNKDTWESLVYYQDLDGDGYITFSSVVCIGAPGPTRDAVIKSILDAGYEYGFPILGFDCDDTTPVIGAYQPIKFERTKLNPVIIQGCSIDAVDNGTRPAFSTEYITTTLDVLLAAGAVLSDGYCSIKRVRYLDYILPSSVKEPEAIFFRRRFLAVDQYDNVAFFERSYTIRDQTKPTIVPLAELSFNNDPGTCGAEKVNVNLTNPVANDNCTSDAELIFSNNAPDVFTIGENLVEWTVTDKSGNIQKAIQKVIVVDNEAPVVKTKNITLSLGLFGTTITPELIDGGTTDNCSFSFKNFKLSLSCANLGENSITLTAKDAAGNESSATAIVTLIDDRAPSFILFPEDVSVSCGNIPEVITPATLDNCNSGVVVSFSESSDQNPDMTTVGHYNYVITRTWKATDPSENSNERSQKITVSDQLAPSIEQIQNIQASCENIPVAIDPGVKDNCDPSPNVSLIELSSQNPDKSSPGHYNFTITRTWTATDASGNESERIQLVNVTDTKSPEWSSIKGSLDVTLYCGQNTGLEGVQNQNPVALDNCDPNPVISKRSGDFIPGALPGSGTYTNTFIATDGSGNESIEFRQVITIIPLTVDASASSQPVQLGLPATLSATVTPKVAGVGVTFQVVDDGGNSVYSEIGITNNEGFAQTTVSDLLIGNYEVIASVGSGCTESVAYLPIYDPNGKFVIGAGWINSPAGAVTDQPELTGKANFGFLSKYKKGNNQVDGDTKFKFNAAGINFQSTFHESGTLVISGRKANYRGEGLINDVPGYKFTVTAIDGQWNGNNDPDQFRIKIWGPTGVVYDNQNGASENSEASTVLGGGSISINDAKGTNKRITDTLIELPWNTPLETVKSKLDQMSVEWFEGRDLKVEFTNEGYDPLASGLYQFMGKLEENKWFELEKPIVVNVLILDKPLPIDIILSNNQVTPTMQLGQAIGNLTTLDPADNIHVYSMESHPEIEIIDNQLIWKGGNNPAAETSIKVTSLDRSGHSISKVFTLYKEIQPGKVTVYPNPATVETNIRVDISEESAISISVYDAVGRLVHSESGVYQSTLIRNLPIQRFSSGIYYIQVKINHQIVTKMLIKGS
jgi:hypothetical protein